MDLSIPKTAIVTFSYVLSACGCILYNAIRN